MACKFAIDKNGPVQIACSKLHNMNCPYQYWCTTFHRFNSTATKDKCKYYEEAENSEQLNKK
jgi:hypothetical protein